MKLLKVTIWAESNREIQKLLEGKKKVGNIKIERNRRNKNYLYRLNLCKSMFRYRSKLTITVKGNI